MMLYEYLKRFYEHKYTDVRHFKIALVVSHFGAFAKGAY
jgi:hypothetical protein